MSSEGRISMFNSVEPGLDLGTVSNFILMIDENNDNDKTANDGTGYAC